MIKIRHRQTKLAPERHRRLRDILRETGVARTDQLCKQLRVSAATVRRDLEMLESDGRICRVHGGALSVESRLEEPLFDDKTSIASREKRRIAQAAARLITPGDTIYLDGGSTVLELARLLAGRTDVTVVTNSLRAAIELSGRGPRLILVGGELRRLSQTMVGTLSTALLSQIHVDKAFMGTIGISLDRGLTTTDPDEAFTKKYATERAERVLVLADGSKLGRKSFAASGNIERVDILITDKGADRKFLRAARRKGLKVMAV